MRVGAGGSASASAVAGCGLARHGAARCRAIGHEQPSAGAAARVDGTGQDDMWRPVRGDRRRAGQLTQSDRAGSRGRQRARAARVGS